MVALILWAVEIITPYLSGMYVDLLVAKNQTKIIIYFIIIIGFINLVKILVQYFTALVSTKLNNTLLYQISSDVNQKIFHSRLSLFKDKDKSYLVDQIRNDYAAVVSFLTDNISTLLLQFVTIIVSGIIIFKADALLCIIIFSIIPIYINNMLHVCDRYWRI